MVRRTVACHVKVPTIPEVRDQAVRLCLALPASVQREKRHTELACADHPPAVHSETFSCHKLCTYLCYSLWLVSMATSSVTCTAGQVTANHAGCSKHTLVAWPQALTPVLTMQKQAQT